MSISRLYLVLLAAAVVAGGVLRLLDTGVAGFSSARGLGVTAGMVVASFLVAALVPTVWVLLFRQRTGSAAAATTTGIAILVVLSYFSYLGMEFERKSASFPFEAPRCTFSASFPGPPELRELVLAGGLVVTQANFYGPDTLMRAECLPTEGSFALRRENVITELRKHAHRNGLMDVEFEIGEADGFVRGVARGWKTVSGKAATYEVHLLADGDSLMSLVSGGVSSGYPQSGITIS